MPTADEVFDEHRNHPPLRENYQDEQSYREAYQEWWNWMARALKASGYSPFGPTGLGKWKASTRGW